MDEVSEGGSYIYVPAIKFTLCYCCDNHECIFTFCIRVYVCIYDVAIMDQTILDYEHFKNIQCGKYCTHCRTYTFLR